MEMYICNSNTLSSLSLNWIKAVKNSGRFSGYVWSEKRLIETTTLDELIEKYGIPQFIKIDVEGYEEEAIKGLSRPVPALSLEFTPEYIESAIRCIKYLEKIGDIQLNYSLGEIPKLESENWMSRGEMIKNLKSLENDNKLYGDLYVKFSN